MDEQIIEKKNQMVKKKWRKIIDKWMNKLNEYVNKEINVLVGCIAYALYGPRSTLLVRSNIYRNERTYHCVVVVVYLILRES